MAPACVLTSSGSHDPQLPCCMWCAAGHRHAVQEALTRPEVALQLLWTCTRLPQPVQHCRSTAYLRNLHSLWQPWTYPGIELQPAQHCRAIACRRWLCGTHPEVVLHLVQALEQPAPLLDQFVMLPPQGISLPRQLPNFALNA